MRLQTSLSSGYLTWKRHARHHFKGGKAAIPRRAPSSLQSRLQSGKVEIILRRVSKFMITRRDPTLGRAVELPYFCCPKDRKSKNCFISHAVSRRNSLHVRSDIPRSLGFLGCMSLWRFLRTRCARTHSVLLKSGAGCSENSLYAARKVSFSRLFASVPRSSMIAERCLLRQSRSVAT